MNMYEKKKLKHNFDFLRQQCSVLNEIIDHSLHKIFQMFPMKNRNNN